MHTIDIIINSFIVFLAFNLWAILGKFVLSYISDYESTESHLLTSFFWIFVLSCWVKIQIEEQLNYIFK